MRYLTLLGAALPLMAMAACKDSIGPREPDGLPAPVISSRGEVLARSTCAPCHGAALRGHENGGPDAPDLRLVAAYTAAEFERLLCTGTTRSGETVDAAMVELGVGRLPDGDRLDLYRYLVAYLAEPTR